ncbi:Asp23/Gls24 family envelope stress response protein [Streptodolium elevatio]
MADTTTPPNPAQVEKSGGAEVAAPATHRGRTSIADGVVAKIAGIAAREITGVYAMGSGAGRVFAAVRQRVPGGKPNVAQGVSVEVGEKQCAVDLALVVDYGVPIAELLAAVRENVVTSLERMTALEVVEVNIAVDDIHIEDDDESDRRIE